VIGGYAGRILHVDLTNNTIDKIKLDKKIARKFLGGRGLGAWLVWNKIKKGIDPLAKENFIFLMCGPLTGLQATRAHLVSKSPLTNLIAQATAGGMLATELKFAHWDGVIISGSSNKPIYIYIKNNDVEIKKAEHLWGLGTVETIESIKEELEDPFVHTLAIGPAGERLVRFAAVLTDYYCAFGRTGIGAVMGSKKLKAITIRGMKGFPTKDLEGLKKAYVEMEEYLDSVPFTSPDNLHVYNRWDNSSRYNYYSNTDTAKVRNMQEGTDSEFWKISSTNYEKYFYVRHWACYGCPGYDKQIVLIRTGPYAGTIERSPSLENTAALGYNCGTFDPEIVIKACELCNNLGMDTISTGNTISFAMECYQRGILKKEDLEGLELSWGNGEAELEMIKKIAYRRGIGNLLAEGTKKAAEKIAKDSTKYAMQIKGLEIPAMGIRAMEGVSSSYAFGIPYVTDGGGARHEAGSKREEQFSMAVLDSLSLCSHIFPWLTYHKFFPLFTRLLNYVTGWDFTSGELLTIGERIWNLERCIAVREGIRRKDDVLPERFYSEPLPSGIAKGVVVNRNRFEEVLDKYYEERGWNKKTGIPTKRKLNELNLEDIARDLERGGCFLE